MLQNADIRMLVTISSLRLPVSVHYIFFLAYEHLLFQSTIPFKNVLVNLFPFFIFYISDLKIQ